MSQPDRTHPAATTAAREEFLGRLRDALVRAINGNPIAVADAWDILREWDRATGTRGDIPNFPTLEGRESGWIDPLTKTEDIEYYP